MDTNQELPKQLRIVAYLFIIAGWLCLAGMVIDLIFGRLFINFGFLGIFVGNGLLRLSDSWRKWAMFFVWLLLISCPIMVVLMFIDPTKVEITFAGTAVYILKYPWQIMLAYGLDAALFCVGLWCYQVLTNPEIKQLFPVYDQKLAKEFERKWEDKIREM